MKEQDKIYIRDIISEENDFIKAVVYKTDFPDIKDEEFHRLRNAFKETFYSLVDYLG